MRVDDVVAGTICSPPYLLHLVVAVGVEEECVHVLLRGAALLAERQLEPHRVAAQVEIEGKR